MIDMRNQIMEGFHQALAHTEKKLLVESVTDDLVLLESGLDSLGFAVLVVILEDKVGFDPFVMMENPVYPRTFGEFVEIYKTMNPELD